MKREAQQQRFTPRLVPVPLIMSACCLFVCCGGSVRSAADDEDAGSASGGTTDGGRGGFSNGPATAGGESHSDASGAGGTPGTGGAILVNPGGPNVPAPCALPVSEGFCDAALARYYFDSRSASCKPFVFTGCDGNANNFPSQTACDNSCIRQIRCRCATGDSECEAAAEGCVACPESDLGSASGPCAYPDFECRGEQAICSCQPGDAGTLMWSCGRVVLD